MGQISLNGDQLWYKDAIIYELHIKAFRDSNRDGIGDFRGLIDKLDYLQELGITAIWVLPFYPSPLRDDGYDIADYYSINNNYGDLDEFRELLNEAHRRNLRVITELVINHTSDQHPWFQRARNAPKDSAERNYYVWTDDPEKYKDVRIIFQDFETSNWTWDPVAGQYYWHRFFHHQPDLNFDSPDVQEEIFRIIDYWCEMGVDAFRLDAIPYLFEREGTNGENLPETHIFLKRLRKHIDEKFPGVAFLAEANMWPEDSASYFGNGDECHMNYHFPVMPRMFMALQQEDRYPITDIFDQTPAIPDNCQWAIFLRNHDELTLEMVTDEERDFMYKVYVKDPKARINLGIRHRLAPLMDNNRSKIELMNSLLFSLPGTPVIYYGDEIGMGDNFYLGDRDGVRTPMQWSPDRNAGFSESNPQQLYLPVILDPEYHYEAVNVEMQRRNTSSLFWFMKRMIGMRKNFQSFSRGDMKFLPVENPKILAFTRSYKNETILVIANLSKYAQPAEIDLREYGGYLPVEIFSKNSFPVIRDDATYLFTLGPHSFQWFILQKAHTQKEDISALPLIAVDNWEMFQADHGNTGFINDVLLPWMMKRKWFKGRTRKIHHLSIQEQFPLQLGQRTGLLWLVETVYESGLPETYLVAVAPVWGEDAQRLSTSCPESIMAQLEMQGRTAMLCDCWFLPEFHQLLVQQIRKGINPEPIRIRVKAEVVDYMRQQTDILARMHSGDENNTSITFDNRFFLKMYRKVEYAINPDAEISNWLSEVKKFSHVPGFLGTMECQTEKGVLVIGLVQVMIENHGDGQTYMTERLNNYIERILARRPVNTPGKKGTITDPVAFDELEPELQTLLGSRASEEARIMGKRTAEMHLALASATEKDLKPEEYSLHYQRSLYSSMQSLVREAYQNLQRHYSGLPDEIRADAAALLHRRDEMLGTLKRIYTRKLDIWKTRIHGSLVLKKLLMTGRDIVIQDFGGNPYRSFSERRIKRSPVRDISEMMMSFHYTAYHVFTSNGHIPKAEFPSMLPYADIWAHYMSGFFLKAYINKVGGSQLLPKEHADFDVVLRTFLIERALVHFNYEISTGNGQLMAPLRMLNSVMAASASSYEPVRE